MSKFKGTKGEWVVDSFEGVWIENTDWQICETDTINGIKNTEERLYNAKLIICAPEMLEALKEMIAFCEFHGYNVSTEINNAKELIKKATE